MITLCTRAELRLQGGRQPLPGGRRDPSTSAACPAPSVGDSTCYARLFSEGYKGLLWGVGQRATRGFSSGRTSPF